MSTIPNYQNIKATYIRDLVERVVWTFVQSFGAQLVASGFFDINGVTDVSIVQKAGVAGIAAVLAVIKGLVAKSVGSPTTAATLPAVDDTPLPEGSRFKA